MNNDNPFSSSNSLFGKKPESWYVQQFSPFADKQPAPLEPPSCNHQGPISQAFGWPAIGIECQRCGRFCPVVP